MSNDVPRRGTLNIPKTQEVMDLVAILTIVALFSRVLAYWAVLF